MRKLSLALVLAISLACVAVVGSAGAVAKPTGAKLTIRSFPEGVFGYLSSASKGCVENRKVVVFEQRGEQPDPGTDPRVGSDRATLDEGFYRWSVDTGDSGRFYAQAVATKGCAVELTGSIEAMNVGGGAGGSEIPACSPYTAEGPSEVCALQGLHYDLLAVGVRACEFGKSSYSCEGYVSGPYPWGDLPSGGRSWTFFNWAGNPRSVVIISQLSKNQEPFLTRMECRISDPSSPRLMVDRAIVRTDTGGTTEFFTPNLPGQAAGEPGGPLYLNFENGKGLGADAYINGYLYVKR